ncbi:outer membrane porin GjpA [Mycolicibacterium sp. 050232]|uniref:outer membrane porin GjpA n=1 Tax=Mycolicibacterium sp. 050232 TaxID=3113982 RepID=UPI002E2BAE83|nr:outer membrane porin GjpA [Mycolicibacterium sp. 050232]MED5815115.1 outer membrane porin GjpA [Mycolicibacterium sp. 050232]
MLTDSLRPYVTAGVVLTAAGAIALAPVSPPDVQVAAPHSASVELTAAADLLTPWVDTFNTASANATKISQFYFEAPSADVQQAIVNQAAYLQTLLNDPASIGDVFEAMGAAMRNALQAATLLGENDNPTQINRWLTQSNDTAHAQIVAFLPMFLPADMDDQEKQLITQAVRLLASPLGGLLVAAVGPAISPAVAALNTVMAGDLLNLPANVVDGFLNGATLNLDAVLPAINGSGVLPEGTTVNRLGIAFGGLLSPGSTLLKPGPGFQMGNIGGSIFNSVDVSITGTVNGRPLTSNAPGQAVGPIGALVNLSRMLAGAIGWSGTGNPLTKLTFPTIDTTPTATALGAQSAVAPAGPAELPSAPSAVATLAVPDADSGAQRVSSTDTDTSGGAAAEGATAPQSDAGATTAVRTAPKPASKIKAAPKKLAEKIRESLRAAPGKRGLNAGASNSGSAEGNSSSSGSDSSSAAPKPSESKNAGDSGSGSNSGSESGNAA